MRFQDKKSRAALLDLIMLDAEPVPDKSFLAFDAVHPWKKKQITNFTTQSLLKPIFRNGDCIYSAPTLEVIREHVQEEKKNFGKEIRRLTNPHIYHVDLSEKLLRLKRQLLEQVRNNSI